MKVTMKKITLPIITISLIFTLWAIVPRGVEAAGNGYLYSATITIDHTKVPNTDQTNFPVLVSGTYDGTGGEPDLRTTGNGGKVTDTGGDDIVFTSDSACATLLDWEVETYTAASGVVNYWVEVPTVATASDTVFYMCYGNASITSDQSDPTGTWDTNFKGVWHLGETVADEGTVTDAYADSTTNNNDGDQQGPDDIAGKVGNGQDFDGTNDYAII